MDKAGRVVHREGGKALGQHGGCGLCEVQLQEWDWDSFGGPGKGVMKGDQNGVALELVEVWN